jgi:hypothetical protein
MMDLFPVLAAGIYSVGMVTWLLWFGVRCVGRGDRRTCLLASLATPLWAIVLAAWVGLVLWDVTFGRQGLDLPPDLESSGWVASTSSGTSCTSPGCLSGGTVVAVRPSTGEAMCASCAAREVEVD